MECSDNKGEFAAHYLDQLLASRKLTRHGLRGISALYLKIAEAHGVGPPGAAPVTEEAGVGAATC